MSFADAFEEPEVARLANSLAVEFCLKELKDVVVVCNSIAGNLVVFSRLSIVVICNSGIAISPSVNSATSEPITFSVVPGTKVSNSAGARVSAHQVRSLGDRFIGICNELSSFYEHSCCPVFRVCTFVLSFNLSRSCSTEVSDLLVRKHVHTGGNEGHDDGQDQKNELEDLENADAHFFTLTFRSAALDGQYTHDEHVDSENVDEGFEH